MSLGLLGIVFMFLVGMLLFITLPIVPKVTGQFKKFANLHLWLAASLLDRAAIVVSEHGDLLLKRMSFDDLGVETMTFDDDRKEFEDPASALHHWLGIPFALADEKNGVLFDPRHAALGERKKRLAEEDEKEYRATQEEYRAYNVHEWKHAVLEFAKDKHELVSLGHVRQLVTGGERAEYPQRTEEFYKISRDPFKDGPSTVGVMMIVMALLGPFGLVWFVWNQGGPSGGGSTVGYSLALLLQIPSLASLRELLSDANENVDWKRAGVAAVVLLPLPVLFLVLALFVSPFLAILAFLALGAGFWAIPLFVLVYPFSMLTTKLARLLFRIGLLGYDRPVLKWTPRKYELVEHRSLDMDTSRDVEWYGLAGSLIGFTFTPDPDSWGPAVEKRAELEEKKEHTADAPVLATDGGGGTGGVPETNLPGKFVRAPGIRRASVYAGFVPSNLRRDNYYVNSGIAWGAFRNSATGKKSMNRLTQAKEVHGGGDTMAQTTLIYATVGCGVFSLLAGIGVFFVLL